MKDSTMSVASMRNGFFPSRTAKQQQAPTAGRKHRQAAKSQNGNHAMPGLISETAQTPQ
jgi:hypothetical protein